MIDDSVKNPKSALHESFVIPEYPSVRPILQDSQALISGVFRNRLKQNFLQNHIKMISILIL